jgi:hypothetical protein
MSQAAQKTSACFVLPCFPANVDKNVDTFWALFLIALGVTLAYLVFAT